MSDKDRALLGRGMICLFWIVLGVAFILTGPRYITPVAAYAAGLVFILLAIFLVIAAIRQRRAKLTAGWTRKA